MLPNVTTSASNPGYSRRPPLPLILAAVPREWASWDTVQLRQARVLHVLRYLWRFAVDEVR